VNRLVGVAARRNWPHSREFFETDTDLPSLPHLAGDSRILDSISRSPAASLKSPAFYKQSQFPFNSTAKIAPRMQNAPKLACLSSKIEKFSGEGAQPPPQTSPPVGRGTSAPRSQRLRRLGLAAKARLPLACF